VSFELIKLNFLLIYICYLVVELVHAVQVGVNL